MPADTGLGTIATSYFAGGQTYPVRSVSQSVTAGLATCTPTASENKIALVQPMAPDDVKRLPEGIRSDRAWRVYPVGWFATVGDATQLGDEIQINGVWCRVIREAERYDDWQAVVVAEVGP